MPPAARLAPMAAAALAFLFTAGCTGAPASPDAGVGDVAYSIAVLPDTQYYASSWPDIFMAQTRWLADNRGPQQLAFVLHTGDIVDADTPEQWSVASQAMHTLDAQLPYVITAGNHDYNTLADRMGMGNVYFPPADFAADAWFQGTFEPDHIENSYSLFDVPGGQWLVLALEFGPRDEVVAWANGVLAAHPSTPAIVITHAYLYRDGTLYDHVNAPTQKFNPHTYVMANQAGSTINDGAELWAKLIEPNSNVKLVFSGHDVSGNDIPPGTAARLTSRRPDGTMVHQILANYQTCLSAPCESARGGDGFLRLVRFSGDGTRMGVETYSPYLDQSLDDDGNRFVVDLN